MYKKMLTGLTLIVFATFMTSCSMISNQPTHSPRGSNLVASPTAVPYPTSSIIIYAQDASFIPPAEEIAIIKIDRYNKYGIKRQQATINEMLKEQACSMGGDAVILIESPEKGCCYAKVVRIKT